MRKFRFRLPSPAMIVALISLVVAMAGTTYAATQLSKNSVGSKQLKKNSVTTAKIKKDAVTGAKVKKQSLTGEDINLAKLGTVPSAQVANTIPPADPTHLVGAPGEPGFEGGSSNFGGEETFHTEPVGFYKDHDGVVHLQGLAKVGASLGIIFSLPPGYRPASGALAFFTVFCASLSGECEKDQPTEDEQAYTRLLIAGSNLSAGGGVVFNGAVVAPPATAVSLEGITFRAKG